jgi:hypothetical protein
MELTEFFIEDVSKKGKIRRTNLRQSVDRLSVIDLQTIEMVIKKYNERTIRPMEILVNCFKLDESTMISARVIKKKQG